MKRQNRDYAKEYARRIERGKAAGKSRATSRGHGEPQRRKVVESAAFIDRDTKLEKALKSIKRGMSLKQAAAEEHVAPERLSRYLRQQTSVTRSKGRLVIIDTRPRQFPIYSRGELHAPVLSMAEATRASSYLREVDRSLSNQPNRLGDYQGNGVRDMKGKYLPFETDVNELYRLDTAGELYFPEFYKITNGEAFNG